MNEESDIALETLLVVSAELGTDLPAGTVEKVYALQKRHQFDADPSASLQEMQRLIESVVADADGRTQ